MAGTYDLDDHEEEWVLRHRQERADYFFKQVAQAACEHDWQWECAMHNDDAYKCSKCGDTKFE